MAPTHNDYPIVVVEDDRTTRLLLQSSLGNHYPLALFESAEDLLAALQAAPEPEALAQLFLLDVGLPGMDGLNLCRQLKAHPSLQAQPVPVLFLSGHDSPEEILAGYEAGGQDYLVKPVDVASLLHKIDNLRRIQTDQQALAAQIRDADQLTTLVLANLDEYAVLVQFLRTLNECPDPPALIAACFELLRGFGLQGVVQTRLRGQEKTHSVHGENWPLEVAVVNHMRKQERVFEHKHLAAFNFDAVTLLVTNMPRHEPELCGRIRHHLAIATETADAKLQALQTLMDNQRMRQEILQVLHSVGHTINALAQKYKDARYQETVHTMDFIDEISRTFSEASMSQEQEEQLLESVRQRIRVFTSIYDIAPQTQETLQVLVTRMRRILEMAS